jgi:phosphate ABC transporter phosphate-binding protein
MSSTSIKRVLVILVVGAGACLAAYFVPQLMTEDHKPLASPARLRLVGTSSAALIVDNGWRTAYRMQKGIDVDYESTGSTKGIDALIDGNYGIAFTHAPLTEAQRKKAHDKQGDLVELPIVLCSVVPIYHLNELKDKPPLNFTGDVLAKIFLGTIDTWDHPELKKINEGVALPATKITVVHRSDASGTTVLFSDYLASVSPEWQAKIGKAASIIDWPVGVGKARTHDLVEYVRRTEGTIGYADLVHPYYGAIQYGAVQNHDQSAFIHAEAKHMTAAAHAQLASILGDKSFELMNGPGKESYPITGAIWAVCYQHQPAQTRDEIVSFLRWAAHDGQQFTSAVFGPLPAELVERVDEKLETIKTGS